MSKRNEIQSRISRLLIRLLADDPASPETMPAPEVRKEDLPLLKQIALRHGLGPLLYQRLSQTGQISEEEKRKAGDLRSAYLSTMITQSRQFVALQDITREAGENGLMIIVLKGAGLVPVIYPAPGMRPMDDLDLLVPAAQLNAMTSLLFRLQFMEQSFFEGKLAKELGKKGSRGWMTFQRGEVVIDLHTGIPTGNTQSPVAAEELVSHLYPCSFQNCSYVTLRHEIMWPHLILHLSKHFRKGVARYSNLVDILLLIKKFNATFDRDLLNQIVERFGIQQEFMAWNQLLADEFDLLIPVLPEVSLKKKDTENPLQQSFNEWMEKGDRIRRPVEPPWERPQFQQLKGIIPRIKYSLSVLFPRFPYMRRAYGIPNNFLVFLYYPVRLITHAIRYLSPRRER